MTDMVRRIKLRQLTAAVLALIMLLPLASCANKFGDGEAEEPENKVPYEVPIAGSANSIVLPVSGKILEVDEKYRKYIPYISDELLSAAETKISEATSKYDNNSGFYFSVDDEGYLCLNVEAIRDIPKEEQNEAVGCIDHEHLFFCERITSKGIDDPVLTENFTFWITWNTYGISSYSSDTKTLIKTTDTTHPEDYEIKCTLSDKELAAVYQIIEELDITSYPDTYDPHSGNLASDPSMSLILSVRSKSINKTVNALDIALTFDSDDKKDSGSSQPVKESSRSSPQRRNGNPSPITNFAIIDDG